MRLEPGKPCAVVTGNVVNAHRLSADGHRNLLIAMSTGSRALTETLGEEVPHEVEILPEEGWRFLVADPSLALRATLFFRAWILANGKVDVRAAIGVGTADITADGLDAKGEGEVFRISERLLSELRRPYRMGFAGPAPYDPEGLDMVVRLVDAVVRRRWTIPRALAVTGVLRGWPQEWTGALWNPPIRQQSVADHLRGADWEIVDRALGFFATRISSSQAE